MIHISKGFFQKILNRILSVWGLHIKRIHSGIWDLDKHFLREYASIQNITVVKIDRSYMLYQFAKMAASLPKGDIAQLGVYKGGTAKMIAECFVGSNKKMFLFDTFEGLPPSSKEDTVSDASLAETHIFNDVHFETVQKLFTPYHFVTFKKGYFPDTAKGLEDTRFCFVYLDADLYQSTKDGLNFFYPRMIPGGVIMLDDFGTPLWPGIQKAVEEFCAEHHISPIKTTWWQGVIIKAE